MQSEPSFLPDYGISSRLSEVQAIVRTDLFSERATRLRGSALSVKERRLIERPGNEPRQALSARRSKHERTVKKHGLTGEEVVRERDALHLLQTSRMPCFWAVLGDELLDLPMEEARAVVDDFTGYIVREQKRAGLPQYWLRVWECSQGLHANIVFPATPELFAKLRRLPKFRPFLKGHKSIQRVTDFDKLGRFYFAKERIPCAKGARRCGRRRKGRHYLEGGGDRVRLSRALKEDALALGMIEPWRSTNARRIAA